LYLEPPVFDQATTQVPVGQDSTQSVSKFPSRPWIHQKSGVACYFRKAGCVAAYDRTVTPHGLGEGNPEPFENRRKDQGGSAFVQTGHVLDGAITQKTNLARKVEIPK